MQRWRCLHCFSRDVEVLAGDQSHRRQPSADSSWPTRGNPLEAAVGWHEACSTGTGPRILLKYLPPKSFLPGFLGSCQSFAGSNAQVVVSDKTVDGALLSCFRRDSGLPGKGRGGSCRSLWRSFGQGIRDTCLQSWGGGAPHFEVCLSGWRVIQEPRHKVRDRGQIVCSAVCCPSVHKRRSSNSAAGLHAFEQVYA